uniref:Uncharacterized protein n=1 Tax=Rhodosorus marinus TaxID=101924 RepID=A0A7S0BU43_9RHOD|mmetsp:Transcript_9606/g.14013  ORF Transcript_9606/g.14013 Transcript_9606/m.14013 type:complete len:497 (+) Transcript_9606:154-1644(+)|eukprot:CAMPEP_0184741990 /NCGR_PEP_ID=MMETSP0315-20130426/4994_1 /TAXON_ID=101924 /ORGANISM="Rhodosorus marinus, Strain UTEX LB 2760" /LENGTH=496 /DNA_ID=CAMNT_0027212603 /DNA_START=139 /DNA_END=1629 /DNA_ORIENTATION=-
MAIQESDRVAIIGAGVSGLATCHALHQKGVECVVLEEKTRAGGLWVDNYYNAHVQTPKFLYEYPELRFPEDVGGFPTMTQVTDYLDEFIDQSGIRGQLRFGASVQTARQLADSRWELEIEDVKTGQKALEEYGYLVVCSGMFSRIPHRAEMKRQKEFAGEILHSSEYRSLEIFSGKKVVVVGSGKSGIDTVVSACSVSDNVVQIARTRMWTVPESLFGIPLAPLFFGRAVSLVLPPYYRTPTYAKWIHWFFIPFKWLTFKLMEAGMLVQSRIPFRAWPDVSLQHVLFTVGATVTDRKYMSAIRKRRFDLEHTTIEYVTANSVVLANGRTVEADVIVLATGWKYDFPIFEKDTVERLRPEQDGLYMYKNMIPVNVERLAFIGSNTSTYTNPFTASVQSIWLAQLIAGDRTLPSLSDMEDEVSRMKEFKRKYYPGGNRATVFGAHGNFYHDDLIREMGIRPRRGKGIRSWFSYWFKPNYPRTWKGIMEEAHKNRALSA